MVVILLLVPRPLPRGSPFTCLTACRSRARYVTLLEMAPLMVAQVPRVLAGGGRFTRPLLAILAPASLGLSLSSYAPLLLTCFLLEITPPLVSRHPEQLLPLIWPPLAPVRYANAATAANA